MTKQIQVSLYAKRLQDCRINLFVESVGEACCDNSRFSPAITGFYFPTIISIEKEGAMRNEGNIVTIELSAINCISTTGNCFQEHTINCFVHVHFIRYEDSAKPLCENLFEAQCRIIPTLLQIKDGPIKSSHERSKCCCKRISNQALSSISISNVEINPLISNTSSSSTCKTFCEE